MIEPKKPASEEARLETLRDLHVLDTLPEDRFDRLVRLAAHIFGVPIALVSLVDEDRQWFKARVGLEATETPRNISFCGHAILGDQTLVVPDATKDPRFLANPLVTGGPKIRFYAGAPLAALNGEKVGTLCVISQEAREMSAEEHQLLSDLAAVVEQELISAELAKARDAALAASRAKSQFLANMSHEIRTPLNAVIGLSELLSQSDLGPEEKDSVETIYSSGTSLLSLINDILDLAKIESGNLELENAPFSFVDVLDEVRGLAATLARDKQLSVDVLVGSDIARTVSGDRTRLRQVLTNLVSNAVKFTEKGSVRVTATAGPEVGERRIVRFEVADTGIGMDKEALGKLFKSFVQADASTTRRYGGTGLGLSITRHLLDLMGGSIEVESEVGRGTRFLLEIPFAVAEAPAKAKPDTERTSARVLAVDDDPINLKVVLAQLGKLGHEAVGASSGDEALRLAAESSFDAILMDVQMPGMDGLETTRRLRATEAGKDLPVIALTASALVQDRDDCLAAGMTAFATKPIRMDKLQTALDEHLGTGSDRPSLGA